MDSLYKAVLEYAKKGMTPFHTPGHKQGRGFGADCAFSGIAGIDLTELDGTDDLHSPEGPIAEAQRVAATAFGAGRTWFLANGSTCGIHAMVMACCRPGQKLLMARNFHYSAWNAAGLARAIPVFVEPSGGDNGLGEGSAIPGKNGGLSGSDSLGSTGTAGGADASGPGGGAAEPSGRHGGRGDACERSCGRETPSPCRAAFACLGGPG
ncbi:MAG: hypothetical protein LBJ10_09325, partial [Clostridiales bacterium]|nr:hypothetical protein [Clostridiales bacterium]